MTERELITQHSFRVMGGPASVAIRHGADCTEEVQTLLKTIEQDTAALEAKYSRYRADSLISRINSKAGDGEFVAIDAESLSLFDFCAVLYEQSDGLFDPTSGVLGGVWDFQLGIAKHSSRLPQLLEKVGWEKVDIRDQQLRLTQEGMALDLGGIVKEYAVDKSIATLREAGFANAVVELAGDVMAIGRRNNDEPWQVGICDPAKPSEALISIELADAALATSGSYHRFIELDGERFSHFLHPLSGMPIKGPRSVSVISNTCITAGAIATVGCLKPLADLESWLQASQLPWLSVSETGVTSGSIVAAPP
ncbi:MAG: FAD:protein FMN transferase [Luminiphilus sp.]|nr:FAD:protein FMN transferase [Luminiphilus sp.]